LILALEYPWALRVCRYKGKVRTKSTDGQRCHANDLRSARCNSTHLKENIFSRTVPGDRGGDPMQKVAFRSLRAYMVKFERPRKARGTHGALRLYSII